VRRRVVVALAVGAVVAAIVVPVMVAGQQQHRPEAPAAAAAPSTTPFIEGQPPSLPPLDQQPHPSDPPQTGNSVKGQPSLDGCPADAQQLLASLRGSDVLERRAAPRHLAEIDCYGGYAVARTQPSKKDSATVIFRYLEMTKSWRAIDADTTAACDGVPKDVRVHLQPCR
jgi:hypothetical protein